MLIKKTTRTPPHKTLKKIVFLNYAVIVKQKKNYALNSSSRTHVLACSPAAGKSIGPLHALVSVNARRTSNSCSYHHASDLLQTRSRLEQGCPAVRSMLETDTPQPLSKKVIVKHAQIVTCGNVVETDLQIRPGPQAQWALGHPAHLFCPFLLLLLVDLGGPCCQLGR